MATGRCGLGRVIAVERHASALLCRAQFGPALTGRQFENVDLFGRPMELQLESVLQERLQHGAFHQFEVCGAFRFSVDPVPIGIHPRGSAGNRHLKDGGRRGSIRLARGKYQVGHPNEMMVAMQLRSILPGDGASLPPRSESWQRLMEATSNFCA
jgi:hypothetical protein